MCLTFTRLPPVLGRVNTPCATPHAPAADPPPCNPGGFCPAARPVSGAGLPHHPLDPAGGGASARRPRPGRAAAARRLLARTPADDADALADGPAARAGAGVEAGTC